MLTAAEAAARLGLSVRAVYDIPDAELPRYMVGAKRDQLRYMEADVDSYKLVLLKRPPLPARVLRELHRLSKRAGLPSPLTSHQLEIAKQRYRRMIPPPWANKEAIEAIYDEARRLTEETGVQHHVDHEIPLQGEYVSGLHVETNLRVMLAADNMAKKNKFEVQ